MSVFRFAVLAMLTAVTSACATVNLHTVKENPLNAGVAAYERGDYAEALRCLKPLAEQGDALAQTRLGSMYYLGLGVPEDDGKAATWFGKAARRGDLEAQVMLGTLYALGAGVPQSYAEAARWFRPPAEWGVGGAQFLLGMLYMNGNGVAQDPVQAYMWLQLAARQGSKAARDACGILAEKMTPTQAARAQAMVKEWQPRRGGNNSF